jgi:hypothetical protein
MTMSYFILFKVHLRQEIQSKMKILKINVGYADLRIKEHVEKEVMNANIVISDVTITLHVQI